MGSESIAHVCIIKGEINNRPNSKGRQHFKGTTAPKRFFCVNVGSIFTSLIVFPLLKISLQFFKRNSDIFSFSDACGWLSLKNVGGNPSSSGLASTQREVHRPLENDLSESAQSSVVVDEGKPLSLAR